jgi:heme O synthase-like polyprenyltransferase
MQTVLGTILVIVWIVGAVLGLAYLASVTVDGPGCSRSRKLFIISLAALGALLVLGILARLVGQ